jgi:hypothetical protein
MSATPAAEPPPFPSPGTADWGARWAPADLDEIADGALTSSPVRRARVTHLVLVDGLPADHWVEESADGSWVSGRTGRRRRPDAPVDRSPSGAQDRELRWLESLVGGPEALASLTSEPTVAVPPPLDRLPPGLRRRAAAIGAECDRHAVTAFAEPELAAVLSRVLDLLLTTDPGFLGRSDRDDTAVGAVLWIGAQANGLVGPQGELLARDLWDRVGLPASSAARGSSVLTRLRRRLPPTVWVDATPPPGAPRLAPTGHAELLTAATRSVVIARRDAAVRVSPGPAPPRGTG